MRKLTVGLCSLAFVLACSMQSADARPKYYKYFKELYPDVKDLSSTKCFTCHIDKKKKKLNNYGLAVKGCLGEKAKNVKDIEQIKKALKAAEGKKSKVEGKTFGDLLKENKLPGENKRE